MGHEEMSASIANHIAEVRRRIPDLGRKVAKIVMEFSMGYCAPDVYRMLATEGSPHFVPGAELLHLTPAPERMQAEGVFLPGLLMTEQHKIELSQYLGNFLREQRLHWHENLVTYSTPDEALEHHLVDEHADGDEDVFIA